MRCEKCGKELVGNQKRWCSLRCSKLGLKALYKKKYRAKILAYNRWYRSLGHRPLKVEKKHNIIELLGKRCQRCGGLNNINVHHIKPLRYAGTNEINNLMLLCFDCHMRIEKRMKGYWIGPMMIIEEIHNV